MRRISIVVAVLALAWTPAVSHAFCGFYVAGADAELYNNATMVVMMRDGTRTVLSMQNNYEGPPENFALVVPVPVVLEEENVKTLDNELFTRVDHLAAPRLVEYWEEDPCMERAIYQEEPMMMASAPEAMEEDSEGAGALGVTIEAQFTVGEYEIVILSARDSGGLDTWLRTSGYSIPEGAEPVLRPYVEAGMKFFVARVDVEQVHFEDGHAMLSPLRFHYDSEDFGLPVRLGLLNSNGTQDLIVHILAPNQRYEVANYENVTIPTNLNVSDDTRTAFPEFYASLFDLTIERNPGAIVTEYAWQATSCDPCPGPVMSANDLASLGADVLPAQVGEEWQRSMRMQSFVLTRLHARYSREALGDDLVFRPAPAIVGGREFLVDGGELEHGAREASANNFQARYAIRHLWEGPMECDNPRRGVWGGPPAHANRDTAVRPATDLAFAPRGERQLTDFVRQNVPELGVVATLMQSIADDAPESDSTTPAAAAETSDDGCDSCAVTTGSGGATRAGLVGFAVFALLLWRRRK